MEDDKVGFLYLYGFTAIKLYLVCFFLVFEVLCGDFIISDLSGCVFFFNMYQIVNCVDKLLRPGLHGKREGVGMERSLVCFHVLAKKQGKKKEGCLPKEM